METIQYNNSNFDLNQLVTGLQKEDSRNVKLTRIFKTLTWILAPYTFFVAIFVAVLGMIIGKSYIEQTIGLIFFSLGFLAFGFLFKSLQKDYESIDFGIPTTEMLRNAAKRYKPWQLKTWFTIIPVALSGVGAALSFQKDIPNSELEMRLLIVFSGYILLNIVGFLFGYLIWRKRQKPLRDKALQLLTEIEK